MTECGTSQAQNGHESVESLLCTVSGDSCFSSKSVYFNKINPEVSGGFLAACHLVKLCLLGSRCDSTSEA